MHDFIKCKRCGNQFYYKAENDTTLDQSNNTLISKETVQFLKKTIWGCLCSNCLEVLNDAVTNCKQQVFPKPDTLKEGFHYYKEDNFFIFTEHYHILRGTCCENGCRHCPYGFKKNKCL